MSGCVGEADAAPAEAKREAGAAGPSWYIASRVTPPADLPVVDVSTEAARERRRTRFARRQQSSAWLIQSARLEAGLAPVDPDIAGAGDLRWLRPIRPARCRWRCAADVGVHGDKDGAHFSGTEHCASIWSCPVCAAVIRATRAEEIQAAAQEWTRQGGSLVFVTLTVRHKTGDGLAGSLDAVLKSWQRLLQGKSWTKFKARFGIEGYIRSTEVTLGENGWHPHIHALFFTRTPLAAADVSAWEAGMFSRWAEYVVKYGARLPTKLRGIDVRPADGAGTVVAQYLAKVQEGAGSSEKRYAVGHEMARFDFKTGRGGSLMPFELLDPERREDDADDRAARALWWEYVTATRGRRAITWSRGLRERVQLPEELTDEEVVADVEARPLRFVVPGREYDRRLRNEPAVAALVLELVESDRAETARAVCAGILPDAPRAITSSGLMVDAATGEVLSDTGPPVIRSA